MPMKRKNKARRRNGKNETEVWFRRHKKRQRRRDKIAKASRRKNRNTK